MNAPGDRTTAGVLAPPPLIFGVPLLAGLLLELRWPWPALPAAVAPAVGIGAVLLGLVLAPSLVAFRRVRTPPEPWKPTRALVTTGIYRLTRNPMYLGMTLLYVGLAAWRNTAWPFLALPGVLATIHVGVVRREERYLEARFGEAYRDYARRVRRWL